MYALEHIVACTYSVHVVTGSKRTCSCATCAQGGDCNSRPRFQSQKVTASRAREIALSNAQHGPRPLRSDEFPDGILGLQEHDAHRVQKANELYQFVTQICVVCTQKGLSWAVENPFSSLFWRTSFWTEAQSSCNPKYVHVHSCMYGAERKKFTTLAFLGMVALEGLHKECDNKRRHKHWGWSSEDGTFSTALAVSYPRRLCKQVAHAVRDACALQDFTMCPVDFQEAALLPNTAEQVSRAMAMEGTTKSNLPNFVPEYRTVLKAYIPRSSCTWKVKGFIEFQIVTPQVTIPAGSRLLEISDRAQGDNTTISAVADTVCTFGVPWTPSEFMQEAARRGHPSDSISSVPEELKRAIWELAASDPVCVAERRAAFFRKWMSIAAEVHEEEKQLKETMDEGVKSVVKAKAQAKWFKRTTVSRSTENKAVRKEKAGKRPKVEEKTFVLKKHTSKYYEHNDGLNPKTSSFAKATTTAKGRKDYRVIRDMEKE